MTWTIAARGSVDDMRQHVEATTCYGDTTQFDAARQLVLSELLGQAE